MNFKNNFRKSRSLDFFRKWANLLNLLFLFLLFLNNLYISVSLSIVMWPIDLKCCRGKFYGGGDGDEFRYDLMGPKCFFFFNQVAGT